MTQAMILAAGEGRRMRPLTLTKPKPLLELAGQTLIEHQLRRIAAAGIDQCVVNIAYLGEQIRTALGDGERYGLSIRYSEEPFPLETGGAINRALPLLADEPFLLINADIWIDYPLADLLTRVNSLQDGHLVLVDNPPHHPSGDFNLTAQGVIQPRSEPDQAQPEDQTPLTFSGLSLLHPRLIIDYPRRREAFPLLEALLYSTARARLSGEHHHGFWCDIGTPDRLQELDAKLRGSTAPIKPVRDH